MTTPYVVAPSLVQSPTGVSWSSIPPNSNPSAQLAEQTNILNRATQMVDDFCHQPLRATYNTEEWVGPNGDQRYTVENSTGIGKLLTARWPVLEVVSGQRSNTASFPPVWQPIPATSLRAWPSILGQPGMPGSDITGAAGVGPRGIDLDPAYNCGGRNSQRVQAMYLNGWPHTSFTFAVAAGSMTADVDDVTGWIGAPGVIYDGAQTESVAVGSVVPLLTPLAGVPPTGPGTVTFATPCLYAHGSGIMLSALPATVQWATIFYAAAQALSRGSTAITIQKMPGSQTGTSGGRGTAQILTAQAEKYLSDYVATWV